jgi:hypothetical protein
MENVEEKGSKGIVKNILIAFACIGLLAGFVHYSTTGDVFKDPQDIVVLEYDVLQVYKVQGDTIVHSSKSPCKIVKTHIEYDIVSRDLTVQIGEQPPIAYTDGKVADNPNNLVVLNASKMPVVFMRDYNDSTLFVLEHPYFVVLSKGKECKNLDN